MPISSIGASLEASVTLYCNDAVYDLLNSIPMDELADLMIVSHVELVKGEGGAASAVEGLGVAAAHATGDKCERCWKYSADHRHPRCSSHPVRTLRQLLWRAKSIFDISGGAPGAKGGAAFFKKSFGRNYGICHSESGLCGRAGGHRPGHQALGYPVSGPGGGHHRSSRMWWSCASCSIRAWRSAC